MESASRVLLFFKLVPFFRCFARDVPLLALLGSSNLGDGEPAPAHPPQRPASPFCLVDGA